MYHAWNSSHGYFHLGFFHTNHQPNVNKADKAEMKKVLSQITWTLQSPNELADNCTKIPGWTL